MMDEPVSKVTFTLIEAVWLNDHIANKAVDEGDPERVNVEEPIARHLLEKLGSVILELMPEDLSLLDKSKLLQADLFITPKEAWLIRDRVSAGDVGWDNVTNVGMNLIKKAYGAILKSHDDSPTGVSTHDELTMADRERIEISKELWGKYGGG